MEWQLGGVRDWLNVILGCVDIRVESGWFFRLGGLLRNHKEEMERQVVGG